MRMDQKRYHEITHGHRRSGRKRRDRTEGVSLALNRERLNSTYNGNDTSHDDGNDTFHHEIGTQDGHGRDTDTGLGGTVSITRC